MQGLQAKRSAYNPGATVVCIKLIRMLGIFVRSGQFWPVRASILGHVCSGSHVRCVIVLERVL